MAQLRQRFAAAGRARIETHHSWPNSMAKLDRIVEACIESHWGSEPRHARKAAGRPLDLDIVLFQQLIQRRTTGIEHPRRLGDVSVGDRQRLA